MIEPNWIPFSEVKRTVQYSLINKNESSTKLKQKIPPRHRIDNEQIRVRFPPIFQ